MNWRIEIKPAAEKHFRKLDRKMQGRVVEALRALEGQEPPGLGPNVRPLLGALGGDYRVRVGDYRILFTPDFEASMIYVYSILPRGSAYKR